MAAREGVNPLEECWEAIGTMHLMNKRCRLVVGDPR